jgi:hypothetical protein
MDGEDDENIKLPYCLENIETGCMYCMKSMLKSTNMGALSLSLLSLYLSSSLLVYIQHVILILFVLEYRGQ